MVTEKDVQHIAELADVGVSSGELGTFTHQFNAIIEYFDILDRVEGKCPVTRDLFNILREDEIEPSLPQEEVLRNAPAKEDGFIKAPRVM
ncbi:Asp-tRNA(Asn)/Glu-tRNA(Gln) amidotransferase subunit GatC [Methanoregula sp.]|uniref:Asp-tRNA(Asn)/Glu-tRNA(Gln) amidotransferase subunit GatC n=1 Tax=Methanoregula sp. TaxID=2052170 RepID=UPI00236C75CF|nr:Asp-tRNA(Asn)/Glu-tRNA(Gln) amidotransferase subunit GatC [Methanoregula sp.]MDD1687216.1 Asp-tRNA(Asn)/Glu-tRNA(Gln) amidotransferase subunit GatC [Methanoregula sp.]